MISRRGLLFGGIALAAAGAGVGALSACDSPSRDQTAVLLPSARALPERFALPYEKPPVKRATTRGGVDRYEIVQRRARIEILPGVLTEVMGYDGRFPGPTLATRRGRPVAVTHHNDLDVPTVVHLHGGHTAADHDGYPTDLVPPGASRTYDYGGDQAAATLWYHDHRMDFTAPQVWRGLAGLHLITDDVEDSLSLPRDDRDLPLLIMDRSFGPDGELRYPSLDQSLSATPGVMDLYVSGVLGDVILVNGRPWPSLDVRGARHRLRIVNGSNARRYDLALDPPPPTGASFIQIGSDGGLLAAPLTHEHIVAAPAERFDVVVDFAAYPPGTTVRLVNRLGQGSTDAVMQFRVGARVQDSEPVPSRLAEVQRLVPAPGATVREWRFARAPGGGGHSMPGMSHAHWVINGRPFDPNRMDARVRLGETEVWRFASDLHHPVHVHLSPFQVLSRGGDDPGPFDAGWKDTIDLRPSETAEVAVRFSEHAGRFLLHCHNLEHEDMAMMAAFETKR